MSEHNFLAFLTKFILWIFVNRFVLQHMYCFVPLNLSSLRQLQESTITELTIVLAGERVEVAFTGLQRIEVSHIKTML